MKKTTLLIISLLISFALTSCASSKKAEAQPETAAVENHNLQIKPADLDIKTTVNHSYLTEEDIGKTVIITGVLQKGSVNYFIKENATSRSAVTITIVGTETADADLAKLVGNTVSITGKLTAASSPWSKEIQYISFEEN